jgi:hypothetical protein
MTTKLIEGIGEVLDLHIDQNQKDKMAKEKVQMNQEDEPK